MIGVDVACQGGMGVRGGRGGGRGGGGANSGGVNEGALSSPPRTAPPLLQPAVPVPIMVVMISGMSPVVAVCVAVMPCEAVIEGVWLGVVVDVVMCRTAAFLQAEGRTGCRAQRTEWWWRVVGGGEGVGVWCG